MLLLICNRELLFIGKRKDEDDMAKSTKTYEERIRALEKKEQESIEATKQMLWRTPRRSVAASGELAGAVPALARRLNEGWSLRRPSGSWSMILVRRKTGEGNPWHRRSSRQGAP